MNSKSANLPRIPPESNVDALVSDFCLDALLTTIQTTSNLKLLNVLEENTAKKEVIDKLKLFEARFYEPSPIENSGLPTLNENEPEFFPFSRILGRKGGDASSSSRFLSLTNRLLKGDIENTKQPQTTDVGGRSVIIKPPRVPDRSFEPLPSDGRKADERGHFEPSNQDINTLWMVTQSEEPSLIYSTDNADEKKEEGENTRINRHFEANGNTQIRLAEQYYADKRISVPSLTPPRIISSSNKQENRGSINKVFDSKKFQCAYNDDDVRPLEFNSSYKPRLDNGMLISNQNYTTNIKRETPKSSSQFRSNFKTPMKSFDPNTLQPGSNGKAVVMTRSKASEKSRTKDLKRQEAKKIDLKGFDSRYSSQVKRVSVVVEKQSFAEHEIRRVLNKEAIRIKREIQTIKSNLESYKSMGSDAKFAIGGFDRLEKGYKFDFLHDIIKDKLHSVKK